MKTRGNTILITGGSAGIGLAMARSFVAAENTVIICGRDQIRLERAKEIVPGIYTIQCDISRDEELVALLTWIQKDFPQLNILINNAAIMSIYDFIESPEVPARIEDEVRTNLLSPMKLTSQLLPVLQRQPTAAVVLVSSGLAYVPVANVAVYCATKAALHSFSHSLRYRLRKTGIRVFELLPPLVDTDLARPLHMPKIHPEQVAKALLRGLARDQYEVRVGQVKALRMVSQLAPGLTEHMLNKAFAR